MKIALVVNSSWNIYNFRQNLIAAFLKRGYEVVAIAPPDKYAKELVSLGCEFHPVAMKTTGVGPFGDLLLFLQLFRIYRKVRPDVYLHYTIKPGIYGTLAAKLAGSGCIINNVCGLGTIFLQKNWVTAVALFLYKISYRFADHVFFQNEGDMKLFLSHVPLKGPGVSVIPGSGIDHERFRPKIKEKGQFTFLMIARLLIDKGVTEYALAASILRSKGIDAKFVLLGQVEERHRRGVPFAQIQHWAKEGVIEYGGVTDSVEDWIASSDAVVLPSYREGLPKVLLEGASMARPLIACDVPGCNSVVKDNVNGFLCEQKDAQSLAVAMQKMVGLTRAARMAMGRRGRDMVVDLFNDRVVVNKYLEQIDQYTSTAAINLELRCLDALKIWGNS